MPSFEVWLPLGAIGLYLFDSTLLLYSNEFLLLRGEGRVGLCNELRAAVGRAPGVLPESIDTRHAAVPGAVVGSGPPAAAGVARGAGAFLARSGRCGISSSACWCFCWLCR